MTLALWKLWKKGQMLSCSGSLTDDWINLTSDRHFAGWTTSLIVFVIEKIHCSHFPRPVFKLCEHNLTTDLLYALSIILIYWFFFPFTALSKMFQCSAAQTWSWNAKRARYLAGRQSSSAVDVSVEVKGGFGDTAAAETDRRDLETELPTADFSLQTQQELRLRPDTLLTHRCQGGGELML